MNTSPAHPVVAVVGSARLQSVEQGRMAEALGDALMKASFRLVTGGLGGVMQAVSKGARESAAWVDGRIIGVVPSYGHDEANPYCDIVIPTGAQVGRNLLVVATGHVVIAMGGGAGTLSEMALAWQLRRPVIALGDLGWAGKLAGEGLDHRHDTVIHAANTVDDAIRLCGELWHTNIGIDGIRAH